MKKVLIGIFVVFLAMVLVIGCEEDLEPEVVNDGNENAEEESGEEESDEEPQDESGGDGMEEETGLKIGDRVKMGDLEFEARSARWEEGEDMMGPDDGERWLVIDVEIENIGDESTSISSMLMFSMYDDQNYSVDQSWMADTRGSLDGELGAGRTMAGEIAFEVPEDSEAFEFIFEPTVFGFGQAIYEIQAGEVD